MSPPSIGLNLDRDHVQGLRFRGLNFLKHFVIGHRRADRVPDFSAPLVGVHKGAQSTGLFLNG